MDSPAINAARDVKENRGDWLIMGKWHAWIVRRKMVLSLKIRFRKFGEIHKKIIPEIIIKIYNRIFKGRS